MPIPDLPLFRHRDTVVTPADQNQFVTQFETTMDTMSNDVIPALNLAITDINEKVITATTARDESVSAKNIAIIARNEAVTAVATLQEGAIDDTIIAPNKAFSNQYIENNYYDKTKVYNKTEVDTAISEATLDINSLSDKPIPSDTDNLAIQETGGLLKKVSFENLTKLNPNDPRVKTALNANGDAPIYACRTWVNFNGTGTVAIRNSGNISSITDIGIGKYRPNLIVSMPDANYSITAGSAHGDNNSRAWILDSSIATSSFEVNTIISSSGAQIDLAHVFAEIIR